MDGTPCAHKVTHISGSRPPVIVPILEKICVVKSNVKKLYAITCARSSLTCCRGGSRIFSRGMRIFKKLYRPFFRSTKLIFRALPKHCFVPILAKFSAPQANFEKIGQKGVFRHFLENLDRKILFFRRALPPQN